MADQKWQVTLVSLLLCHYYVGTFSIIDIGLIQAKRINLKPVLSERAKPKATKSFCNQCKNIKFDLNNCC